jgi:hypothetical protein
LDTQNWIVLLLSGVVILTLVFGILIVLRLASIDQSMARTTHVLEYEILPGLKGLLSTELGTTGHEIRAIQETVRGLPTKLDVLARKLSTFTARGELDTGRGPLKEVGVGDILSDIARDVSTIGIHIRKKQS